MEVTIELTKRPMKRVAVYLPDGIFENLEKHATDEGRPISNLAAFLIEVSLRELKPMKTTKNKEEKNNDEEP